MIFNRYEDGESPLKCGVNVGYRLRYWLHEDPKPESVLGASALLMMFHA
jgi:hypothetical protein